MRARLFARFGPEAGLEVEFGAEATIGRGKDNSVRLSSPEVSQHHARIVFDADSAAYWVEDLGSLNGTRLDGEPLSGRQRLAGLHVLSFGVVAELFFVGLDAEPAAPREAAPRGSAARASGDVTRIDAEAPTLPIGLRADLEADRTRIDAEPPTLPVGLSASPGSAGRRPGSETRIDERPAELPPNLAADGAAAEPAGSRFVLEVAGADGGRFELAAGDNLVGRSKRARVCLPNRELSRRHATLRVAGERVWLRDEGSRNHTFAAGERVSEEVEIVPGSELRFGRLEARLTRTGDAAGDGETE